MKKIGGIIISFIFSAILSASVSIGVFAAEGDVLGSYDFENVSPVVDNEGNITSWKNGWEASRNDGKISAFYGDLDGAGNYFAGKLGTYRKPSVLPPAATGEQSMYIASSSGSNAESKYCISPSVTKSGTGVYDVAFELMLVSSDYGHAAEKEYYIALGDGTNYNFKLSVNDDYIYYWDGTTSVKTEECTDVVVNERGRTDWSVGKWYHVELKIDMNNKMYKGTLNLYDGDELSADTAVTIPWSSFNSKNAVSLTQFTVTAVRRDNGEKGTANIAIDNLIIKEAADSGFRNVTIRYVSGGKLLKTETVSGEQGTRFTAGDAQKLPFTTDELRARKKYYKYTAEGSEDSAVIEDGTTLTLNYELADMPLATINAVTGYNFRTWSAENAQAVGTIASEYVLPGERVFTYMSEYILGNGGHWYHKATHYGETYSIGVTAGYENTQEVVNYDTPAFDVVFFREGEDFENTHIAPINHPEKASGGNYGNTDWDTSTEEYQPGYSIDPVMEAGTYEITISTHYIHRGMAVGVVSHTDGDIQNARLVGATAEAGIYTYTAELEAGDYFYLGKNSGELWVDGIESKGIDDLDYVVVKNVNAETGEVPEEVATEYDSSSNTIHIAHELEKVVYMDILKAVYDENGTLQGVEVQKERIEPGDGTDIQLDSEVPSSEKEIAFIWKFCEGFFIPLTDAIPAAGN